MPMTGLYAAHPRLTQSGQPGEFGLAHTAMATPCLQRRCPIKNPAKNIIRHRALAICNSGKLCATVRRIAAILSKMEQAIIINSRDNNQYGAIRGIEPLRLIRHRHLLNHKPTRAARPEPRTRRQGPSCRSHANRQPADASVHSRLAKPAHYSPKTEAGLRAAPPCRESAGPSLDQSASMCGLRPFHIRLSTSQQFDYAKNWIMSNVIRHSS